MPLLLVCNELFNIVTLVVICLYKASVSQANAAVYARLLKYKHVEESDLQGSNWGSRAPNESSSWSSNFYSNFEDSFGALVTGLVELAASG